MNGYLASALIALCGLAVGLLIIRLTPPGKKKTGHSPGGA